MSSFETCVVLSTAAMYPMRLQYLQPAILAACKRANSAMVRLLLEAGADPYKRSRVRATGWQARSIARQPTATVAGWQSAIARGVAVPLAPLRSMGRVPRAALGCLPTYWRTFVKQASSMSGTVARVCAFGRLPIAALGTLLPASGESCWTEAWAAALSPANRPSPRASCPPRGRNRVNSNARRSCAFAQVGLDVPPNGSCSWPLMVACRRAAAKRATLNMQLGEEEIIALPDQPQDHAGDWEGPPSEHSFS